MTNIELHFYESAIRFFQENSNHQIDWEQRRFEAAAIILSGLAANFHNSVPSPYKVEAAVLLADNLIQELKKKPME